MNCSSISIGSWPREEIRLQDQDTPPLQMICSAAMAKSRPVWGNERRSCTSLSRKAPTIWHLRRNHARPSISSCDARPCSRLAERTLTLLRETVARLPDVDRSKAQQVLEMESAIGSRMRALLTVEPTALRIRCHGDYHLGQVLYTDGDFVIIDFEGEPARPLAERRTKHLPIMDLAGMIRSFHYAAYVALRERVAQDGARDGDDLEPWARTWYRSARAAFIQGYMKQTAVASFQPRSQGEFTLLLNVHLLEKAVYELGYELNNRPAWVAIPLHGILKP